MELIVMGSIKSTTAFAKRLARLQKIWIQEVINKELLLSPPTVLDMRRILDDGIKLMGIVAIVDVLKMVKDEVIEIKEILREWDWVANRQREVK